MKTHGVEIRISHLILVELVLIFIALLLVSCTTRPAPEAVPAATQEENIRQEARLIVDEYFRLGGIVASANPRLTTTEMVDIGRAIYEYANRFEVAPDIVAAVIVVESSGDPNAVSPKGAVGLMQVMPRWKKELGIDGDLTDVDTNIRIGTFILSDNIRRWGFRLGVQRYYWGTKRPDGKYLAKVLGVLEGLDG